MGLFGKVTKADVMGLQRALDALSDEIVSIKRVAKKRNLELVNVRSRLKHVEEFLASSPSSTDTPTDEDDDDVEVIEESREEQRLRLGRQHG